MSWGHNEEVTRGWSSLNVKGKTVWWWVKILKDLIKTGKAKGVENQRRIKEVQRDEKDSRITKVTKTWAWNASQNRKGKNLNWERVKGSG